MNATKPLRVPAIDGLRAVAALAVVVFHTWEIIGAPRFAHRVLNAAGGGYLGVDMFFVISGFVMFLPFATDQPFRPRAYARRRVARILPAYYVSIAVVLAVWSFALHQPPSTHHPLTTGDGVFQVAMHLVMAQALVLPIVHATFGLGIDGAWWTLTWEAMYYGVLPEIARRFRQAPTAYTIGALVVATATRIVAFRAASVMHHLPEAVQLFVRAMAEGIIGYGGHFAVGMLVAWTVARRAAPRRWTAFLLAAGGFAVTAAVWLWLGDLAARDHAVQPRWMAYFVGRPVLAVGFGAFLFGAAHLERANALLGSRPLKWIGDRSYGVYLFHSIAIALLYNGVLHSQPTAAGLLRGLAVIVPIALVAGAISYRWVEQPAIRWARRRETATDRARHRVEDAAAP